MISMNKSTKDNVWLSNVTKDKANPDATAESALEMDSRIRSTSEFDNTRRSNHDTTTPRSTVVKHLKPKRSSNGRQRCVLAAAQSEAF